MHSGLWYMETIISVSVTGWWSWKNVIAAFYSICQFTFLTCPSPKEYVLCETTTAMQVLNVAERVVSHFSLCNVTQVCCLFWLRIGCWSVFQTQSSVDLFAIVSNRVRAASHQRFLRLCFTPLFRRTKQSVEAQFTTRWFLLLQNKVTFCRAASFIITPEKFALETRKNVLINRLHTVVDEDVVWHIYYKIFAALDCKFRFTILSQKWQKKISSLWCAHYPRMIDFNISRNMFGNKNL